MMKSYTKLSLAFVLMLVLGACSSMNTTQKRTMTGAGIGAASGALVGQLATGQPLHGAAIGAAAGAAGGWLYDRHERNQ